MGVADGKSQSTEEITTLNPLGLQRDLIIDFRKFSLPGNPSQTIPLKEIDGAIFLIEKFCDAHAWTFPHLRDLLQKNNLPTLRIELGEAIAPMGQIRTRVGAFYEMIEGKKA